MYITEKYIYFKKLEYKNTLFLINNLLCEYYFCINFVSDLMCNKI